MHSLYTRRSRPRYPGPQFLIAPRRGSALLNSLIAHWRLDEASGTRADSHGANNLSDVNSVGQAAGIIGNAAQFVAASEQSLSIGDNTDLSMGNIDFTIAGWVYFDSLAAAGLLGKWGPGPVHEYLIHFDGTNIRFNVSSNGANSISVANSQSIATATWYFFVTWHDAAGDTINLSINNNAAASSTHSLGVLDSNAVFNLAQNEEGLAWLDGRLDSVSIWKRLLTAAERTQLYNGGAGLDYPFA